MPASVRSRLPLLVGVALALEFWAELFFTVPADTPYRGLVFVLLGVLAVAVVEGRKYPLAGAVTGYGVVALLPALSHVYYDQLFLAFAAPFVTAYWLGAHGSRRTLAIAIVPCTVLSAIATEPYDNERFTGALFTVMISLVAPIVVGRLLRSRAALNRALREKAALLERRREEAAGRAVVDERTRIAGELHDVVAHALSAMTVQATGARRLALTRPELALAAFGAIETAGREALDELRRLLGVLRREDAEITLNPQPSLRHVGSLLRRTAAAGLPVTIKVEGDERELAAGLDVTAYRVVQDALAAALDVGGAGRAEVRLRYSAAALEVVVRDDGPGAAAARPLMGIRERVVLHGGRFVASPRRGAGGHIVRATLPLDGAPIAQTDEPAEPPCELSQRRDRALRSLRAATLGRVAALRTRGVTARRGDATERRGLPPASAAVGAPAGARPLGAAPVSLAAPAPRGAASRLFRRLSRADRFDLAGAAVLAVAGMVEVAFLPTLSGPLVANLVVALGYTLPFAWRRRAPIPAALTVVVATLTMAFFLTPIKDLFVPFVVVLAVVYTAAAYRDGVQAYSALGMVLVAMPIIVATFDHHEPGDYFFPPLAAVLAWLAGRIVRARTRLSAELHETAARLAEANEDAQRQAATDERRRIAREMHDLVAHSMSVMVVQAGGARRILAKDPARALEAATRIERTGREALGEMRHLLGVLNGSDQPPALAPQPTLAEIGELVARARAAGLPTVLEFRGDRRDLPAGLDLAAYRIVQEGLTNALKHAGRAPTTVIVDWSSEHALTLEIRDHGHATPRNGASGHGLVGMRERVRLYGGELDTGPADGGGWRVRATLPMAIREELTVA
ncbi:sensor histidine kinase [Solirubrobacter soli]|uniref:sensor histidine kinase n=1 Tax=Solirubrobacter soli TaxID=363832 RepID=UPI00146E78DE|nr:histidine kinase [Solirubrobacter soli]